MTHLAPRTLSWSTAPALAAASLGGLLLYLARFGYDYGTSDQDELLPYLFHRLNPSLFAEDWFVQTQAAGFGVRTYVVSLLEGLAGLMPVPVAVALLYLLAWGLLSSAVFALSLWWTRQPLAAIGATWFVLALTPQWTLGGNDLAHAMFVPSMLAWGLGLWGVRTWTQGHPVRAGLWLGAATWMQALVGLQLAGLCGLVQLFFGWRRLAPWPDAWRLGLTFVVVAAPALGPLVVQQMAGAPVVSSEVPLDPAAPSALWSIMATFRNPHHYLPSGFSGHAAVRFAGLAVLGLAAIPLLKRRTMWLSGFDASGLLLGVGLLGVVGWIGTEVRPTLFIAKLQLFKATVLAKVILGIALTAVPVAFLRLKASQSTPLVWGLLALVLMGWLGAGLSLRSAHVPAAFTLRAVDRVASPLGEVATWARQTTPPDAVFAIPPTESAFRTMAQRGIAINFKAFPYRDPDILAWYTRLQDWAPVPLHHPSTAARLTALDEAYHALPAASLLTLADQYEVTYLLRAAPLAPHPELEQVFTASPYHVYRVRSLDS
ncbi:MAG: DUF6798 domain-containing protein [Bacteroidota bacterium]